MCGEKRLFITEFCVLTFYMVAQLDDTLSSFLFLLRISEVIIMLIFSDPGYYRSHDRAHEQPSQDTRIKGSVWW